MNFRAPVSVILALSSKHHLESSVFFIVFLTPSKPLQSTSRMALFVGILQEFTMVKFSKQLEAAMVPEWKRMYVNYKELKRLVYHIQQERLAEFNNARHSGSMSSWSNIGSNLSNLGEKLRRSSSTGISICGSSSEIIGIPRKVADECWSINYDDYGSDPVYESSDETELVTPLAHAEQDRKFFLYFESEKLKVNTFYKKMEEEYGVMALDLEKQLLAFFELQEDYARQTIKIRNVPKIKDQDSSVSSDSGFSTSMSREDSSPLRQFVVPRFGPLHNSKSIGDELFADGSIYSFHDDADETTNGCSIGFNGEMATSINMPVESAEFRGSRASNASNAELNSESGTFWQLSKALSWSTIHGSFRGVIHNHGSSTSADTSPEIDLDDGGTRSPFHGVKTKGDWSERVHRLRQTWNHSSRFDQNLDSANFPRPKTRILQDIIDIHIQKKKVQASEKKLRSAFIELYRRLTKLKSYSAWNLVAFAKIMKKYDKAAKHRMGLSYIKEVECSYFASSDVVSKLMAKVEDIFTKHFADHDRRKAMAQLNPPERHGGQRITFFLGIFSGLTVALLIGFLILLPKSAYYQNMGSKQNMDSAFRVFSSLGLILLHMFMYGWNVYAWQKTRINYVFIFEFSPGTELRYRQILLVCTTFSSMLLATMIAHLVISNNDAPTYYSSEIAPMVITLVFLLSLLAPVNILYKSSRVFFLHCMKHILLVPLYKVVLADFFLADQLTSQLFTFRNIEFLVCYYSGGYFQNRDEAACNNNMTFRQLMFVFSLLPYWYRFLQCLRRWRDEDVSNEQGKDEARKDEQAAKDGKDEIEKDGGKSNVQENFFKGLRKLSNRQWHLLNAGKYGSAMVAVAFKLKYASVESTAWLALFIIFSCLATFYQLYWDLAIDWGLLNRKSKNPWLRNNLVLKRKYIYFISMAVNIVLRLAWISSIQQVTSVSKGISSAGWDIMFAALEVIRRGQWNFYRLENEHLNNVGNFRADKHVPLPFRSMW